MSALNKNRGFSLIELLLAMTIAAIALLGVSNLYVNAQQASRLQGMQSRLSEDGRFAVAMLQRVIGQAGYRAPGSAAINNHITNATATGMTVAFTADNEQIGCTGAVATAGATSLILSYASNALTCTQGGVATNWLAAASSGAGSGSVPVDLAFSYGLDTTPGTPASTYLCARSSGDCVTDSYVSTPTSLEAPRIVAVRICFVLKSEQTDPGITKAGTTSNCAGTAISGSDTDKHLYRKFTTTVALRNY
jgi:prepilin-type N-terminal cleavage/methylation domain-containing protein